MNIRRIVTWLCSILTLVSLLGFTQHTQAQDRSSRLVWAQVNGIPGSAELADVFMVDQNNAWAVGKQGTLGVAYKLTFDGQNWSATPGPTFGDTPLNAVVVSTTGQVWVVGEDGLIAQSNPRSWTPLWLGKGISLRTIQLFGDGTSGWAAGAIVSPDQASVPVMYRLRNGQWQRDLDINGEGTIESLHFAPDGGWAVGGERIWRYTNGRWQNHDAPEPCGEPGCGASLMSVRAISGDEAWVVGSRQAFCAVCVPRPYAIHRDGGQWQVILPNAGLPGWPIDPSLPAGSGLESVAFIDRDHAIAAGTWIDMKDLIGLRPLLARYENGAWRYMETPAINGALHGLSMADDTHALAVGTNGLVLAYGYGPLGQQPQPGNPAAPVSDPNQPDVLYFRETGHTLRGEFLNYWRTYGGLAQFGFPVTEEFVERNPDDGKDYMVQYFERARFEYHPEHAGTRYVVLLGLLGHTVTEGRKGEAPFQRTTADGRPGSRYYAETGHNIAPEFVKRWEGTGGLPVYGFPISEAFLEVSPTDGKTYLVQYFERNRFEYHPEHAGTYYEVLLGLLGSEVLRARGWL